MPSGQVHVLVNLLVFFSVVYFFGLWGWLVYLPVFIFYSLLPDLDANISPAAVFVKRFCVIGFILGVVAYYVVPNFWVGIFALACLLLLVGSIFSGHRQFFHSPVAAVLLSVPLWYFGLGWFLGGLVGYLLHEFLDGELFQGGWFR